MKHYCLTDCFKRKLSKGWENTIEILTIAGIIILGLIILAGIFTGIGYIAVEYLGFKIPDKGNYTTLGLILSTAVGIIGLLGYWLFQFAFFTSKKTTAFIKDRYEGKEFECSIFEECKTEKDTSSEPETTKPD